MENNIRCPQQVRGWMGRFARRARTESLDAIVNSFVQLGLFSKKEDRGDPEEPTEVDAYVESDEYVVRVKRLLQKASQDRYGSGKLLDDLKEALEKELEHPGCVSPIDGTRNPAYGEFVLKTYARELLEKFFKDGDEWPPCPCGSTEAPVEDPDRGGWSACPSCGYV